jgi:hypothetical protein
MNRYFLFITDCSVNYTQTREQFGKIVVKACKPTKRQSIFTQTDENTPYPSVFPSRYRVPALGMRNR